MTSDPLGAYFPTPKNGVTPIGDYFSATPGGQLTGFGASPDGLGSAARSKTSLLNLSPAIRDVRKLTAARKQRKRRALTGLGAEGDPAVIPAVVEDPAASPAVIAMGLFLGVVVRGAAGYAVGKAVAPSADKEKSYALWGIPIGVFFGTLGLGVQAAVSLSKR